MIEGARLGAAGCISATANLNPANIARLIASIDAGAPDQALNDEVAAFRKVVAGAGPVPAQKALMTHWTGDDRWSRLRPPLMPMADPSGLIAEVGGLPGYTKPDFA